MIPDRFNLPPELLEIPQFILWFEERKGGKLTKVPSAPWRTGHWKAASATDPLNWTSFDIALEHAKKRGYGVGFCFRKGGGIAGIDLDKCIGKDGKMSEFASMIVRKAKSYSELSPSEMGIHVIVKEKGEMPNNVRAKEGGIEIYDKDRFFTLTGRRCTETPLVLRENDELLQELFAQFGEEATPPQKFTPPSAWGEDHIPITKVVPMEGLKKRGKQYQGAHPVHGSDTGMNFSVNLEKNTWFCYRHFSGGGPLSWLAVQEKIIECQEAKPGALRGDKFRRALALARERGLIKGTGKVDPTRYFTKRENGEVDKFVPKLLADDIMEDHHFATHRQSWVIYRYKDGIYLPDGEATIRELCRERLGHLAREHHINEVVKHIQDTTFAPPEKFDPPVNLICLENGVFDMGSGELKPHGPNPIFINQLQVGFNPGAECPKIMKFLSEILHPDDIPVVQEIAGYCLLRDYRFAKAVMLLGAGRNGKTTLLNLIATLLGRQNVAAPSLQELIYNRFAKADLYGKLADIHADIPTYRLRYTGIFKMLTGQDIVRGEQKHKNPFEFRNYAKLLYSANELPQTDDMSEAFWRRWIVIDFPNTFFEDDPRTDPNLLEKLTTPEELSGFLNWALGGLRRLLENGGFTMTKTRAQIEEEWIMRTDSLRAFINKHVKRSKDHYVTKDMFYEAYQTFCEDHDAPVIEKAMVGRRLPVLLKGVGSFRPVSGGKRPTAWRGIMLSEPFAGYNYVIDVRDISSYFPTVRSTTAPSTPTTASPPNPLVADKGITSKNLDIYDAPSETRAETWIPCEFVVDHPRIVCPDPEDESKIVELGPFGRGDIRGIPTQSARQLEKKGIVKIKLPK